MAAATDPFQSYARNMDGSADHLVLVTPDDANDLAYVTRAVWLSAAGALKVTTVGGETLVIPSGMLAAGLPHPIRATRIWATGTGASTIMVGW